MKPIVATLPHPGGHPGQLWQNSADADHGAGGRAPVAHRHRPDGNLVRGRAGGFGAVMSSKKPKTLTVIGSRRVPVADRARLRALFKAVGNHVRPYQTGLLAREMGIDETTQQKTRFATMPARPPVPRPASSISPTCPAATLIASGPGP